MRHPDEEKNKNQAEFLENIPEHMRKEHALLFSIGNASYIYHTRAKEEIKPTLEDFNDWLEGLAGNIRRDMEKIGFEKCKTMFPFTRHVMERNDIGMDEWMRQNLDAEALAHWEKQHEMYGK
jgi:hypothetical protein